MMPWDGSGNFTRSNGDNTGSDVWMQDKNEAQLITASRHDAHDEDLATGLENALTKDGQNSATANLNIGGNRLTNIGEATARTDSARVSQVQDGDFIWLGLINTGVTTLTATATPAITAYKAGQRFVFIPTASSNVANLTMNINSLGAKTIKSMYFAGIGFEITANSLIANIPTVLTYDGTYFIVDNCFPRGIYLNAGTTTGTANAQVFSDVILEPRSNINNSIVIFKVGTGLTNTASATINSKTAKTQSGATLSGGELIADRYYIGFVTSTDIFILNSSSPWRSWTPTLTTDLGTMSGSTVTGANYKITETNEVSFEIQFSWTQATANANDVRFTLPVSTINNQGSFSVFVDSGIGANADSVCFYNTTTGNVRLTTLFQNGRAYTLRCSGKYRI